MFDTESVDMSQERDGDIYCINGPHFNPDMYIQKLVKESSLEQLMDQNNGIISQIQQLDSDMQTLVYENYNKFISATDTIRKMKTDFKKMEEEMDLLAANMSKITEFSGQISETLHERRQQIGKLSGVHSVLKKLQFLFELPTTLKECLNDENYPLAVKYHTKARCVLQQYEHLPSFRGIQEDCGVIVEQLKEKLREKIRGKEVSPQQLTIAVDLLLQLEEPVDSLCEEFLAHARQRLENGLSELKRQSQLFKGAEKNDRLSSSYEKPLDILEFIDLACNGFLSDMCLVIASYNDVFINQTWNQQNDSRSDRDQMETIATKMLADFVNDLVNVYFTLVEERVAAERETGKTMQLVRALDRFYRRLQAMSKLLPHADYASQTGLKIVSRAGSEQATIYLEMLQNCFKKCIAEIRQTLSNPRVITQDGESNNALSDLLSHLMSSINKKIEMTLAELQVFIEPDLTFAQKVEFRQPFCNQHVREGLVVAYINYLADTAVGFCETQNQEKEKIPSELVLLLSRFCLNFATSGIQEIMMSVDADFSSVDKNIVTSADVLTTQMQAVAQKLLDHYVAIQGSTISQMLRKSVETRDWLHTIEPRNVRAVMKRVVEDISAVDVQVGALYEEGQRKQHSSDSSRRTFHSVATSRQPTIPAWSMYGPSQLDSSLASNIQKLFSERIEIFGSVEFSKMSILSGIIKISLKTFLECVRLRTFSRHGLQQVQVDMYYLQLYLWPFVSDENLVHSLLDEILGSVLHRCFDPVLMEHSVVKLIAERG